MLHKINNFRCFKNSIGTVNCRVIYKPQRILGIDVYRILENNLKNKAI